MHHEHNKIKVVIVISCTLVCLIVGILFSLSDAGYLLGFPGWDDAYEAAGLSDAQADSEYDFTVHYIDVGQGDCIFIESGHSCVLIDAGDVDKADTVIDYLNSLNVSQLSYVIATHPHSDHIGALDDVINTFQTKSIIMPRLSKKNIPTTKCYENLLAAIEKSKANVYAAKPGARYEIGDAVMTVLSPISDSDDLNDMSVVLNITYGQTSFLFTGDAGSSVEKEILAGDYSGYLQADVLKAGHHGSRTSSCNKFLSAVSPLSIVISCGLKNDYGHPHTEAMKRFEKTGAKIYRTDYDGTVVLGSDGESVIELNCNRDD